MNSLPPPIPPPPLSVPPVPPLNDGSNFAGPLRYDRLAIASLVCAIVSFMVYLWIPAAPVAFVLGILALKRIKAEPERLKGRGMALAGMILGAIPIVALVAFIVFFLFMNSFRDGGGDPWK